MYGFDSTGMLVLPEGVTQTTKKGFSWAVKCSHCGHKWRSIATSGTHIRCRNCHWPVVIR